MSRWFLSHASQDRAYVETELLGLFHALGYETWYSRENIHGAEEWERSIKAGLHGCEWFVLVMSPRSAQSEWVRNELQWAMLHRPGRVIPLMIESCEMDRFHEALSQLQYIDMASDRPRGRHEFIALLAGAPYRVSLGGNWEGLVNIHQYQPGQPSELPLNVTLTFEGNAMVGACWIPHPDADYYAGSGYTLNGYVRHARFIHLTYESRDPGRTQFGSMLLELDPTGKSMTGKLIGFGAVTRQVVSADVSMRKSSPSSLDEERQERSFEKFPC